MISTSDLVEWLLLRDHLGLAIAARNYTTILEYLIDEHPDSATYEDPGTHHIRFRQLVEAVELARTDPRLRPQLWPEYFADCATTPYEERGTSAKPRINQIKAERAKLLDELGARWLTLPSAETRRIHLKLDNLADEEWQLLRLPVALR